MGGEKERRSHVKIAFFISQGYMYILSNPKISKKETKKEFKRKEKNYLQFEGGPRCVQALLQQVFQHHMQVQSSVPCVQQFQTTTTPRFLWHMPTNSKFMTMSNYCPAARPLESAKGNEPEFGVENRVRVTMRPRSRAPHGRLVQLSRCNFGINRRITRNRHARVSPVGRSRRRNRAFVGFQVHLDGLGLHVRCREVALHALFAGAGGGCVGR